LTRWSWESRAGWSYGRIPHKCSQAEPHRGGPRGYQRSMIRFCQVSGLSDAWRLRGKGAVDHRQGDSLPRWGRSATPPSSRCWEVESALGVSAAATNKFADLGQVRHC
jgi:hypothetical protein